MTATAYFPDLNVVETCTVTPENLHPTDLIHATMPWAWEVGCPDCGEPVHTPRYIAKPVLPVLKDHHTQTYAVTVYNAPGLKYCQEHSNQRFAPEHLKALMTGKAVSTHFRVQTVATNERGAHAEVWIRVVGDGEEYALLINGWRKSAYKKEATAMRRAMATLAELELTG